MTNTITYQDYPNANRNYKDALFRMAFSEKEDLLDFYNAINGSSYSIMESKNNQTVRSFGYQIRLTIQKVVLNAR